MYLVFSKKYLVVANSHVKHVEVLRKMELIQD